MARRDKDYLGGARADWSQETGCKNTLLSSSSILSSDSLLQDDVKSGLKDISYGSLYILCCKALFKYVCGLNLDLESSCYLTGNFSHLAYQNILVTSSIFNGPNHCNA